MAALLSRVGRLSASWEVGLFSQAVGLRDWVEVGVSEGSVYSRGSAVAGVWGSDWVRVMVAVFVSVFGGANLLGKSNAMVRVRSGREQQELLGRFFLGRFAIKGMVYSLS